MTTLQVDESSWVFQTFKVKPLHSLSTSGTDYPVSWHHILIISATPLRNPHISRNVIPHMKPTWILSFLRNAGCLQNRLRVVDLASMDSV